MTELDALLATLAAHRRSFLGKLAGLHDDAARRALVPSGTNLAGLLQHLTFVEDKFLVQTVGGRKHERGLRSMVVAPELGLASLRAAYRDACAESDTIARAVGDPSAPLRGGKGRDLRWALLAVIGETARHAGHADILREQLDGTTGR